jgi:hypothetical protein
VRVDRKSTAGGDLAMELRKKPLST